MQVHSSSTCRQDFLADISSVLPGSGWKVCLRGGLGHKQVVGNIFSRVSPSFIDLGHPDGLLHPEC